MKLDKFDVRILSTLQQQGRLANARLADVVGLSSSATWERVQRLERNGFIRGYHADIAIGRIPEVAQVVVPVVLSKHRANDFRRFEQAVSEVDEVAECLAVGGGVDYVLRFVVADAGRYQELMDQLLSADIGIERYWSYVVTKPVKPFAGFPLERLLSAD